MGQFECRDHRADAAAENGNFLTTARFTHRDSLSTIRRAYVTGRLKPAAT